MGKGDQRSRRGKIFRGTFGKTRPRNKKISSVTEKTAVEKVSKTTKKITKKSKQEKEE